MTDHNDQVPAHNDLMPAQEKLEWVTPKISLMDTDDTQSAFSKDLSKIFNMDLLAPKSRPPKNNSLTLLLLEKSCNNPASYQATLQHQHLKIAKLLVRFL